MTNTIYWMLHGQVAPGQAAALTELAATFCRQTALEPGVIAYEWALSDDGAELRVYERFQDSAAALAHLGNVGPLLPQLMARVSVTAIECHGDPSPEFRAAMAAMPIHYYRPMAGFHR